MKRSVWAVVAGAIVIVVGTTAVDAALHVLGVYPPWGEPIDDVQSLIGTGYRVLIGVAGAWLTARLAPARPLRHAMILGCIGAALGFVGVLATWNHDLGPRWYPISHVVLAIPEAWAGGRLFALRSASQGVTDV